MREYTLYLKCDSCGGVNSPLIVGESKRDIERQARERGWWHVLGRKDYCAACAAKMGKEEGT